MKIHRQTSILTIDVFSIFQQGQTISCILPNWRHTYSTTVFLTIVRFALKFQNLAAEFPNSGNSALSGVKVLRSRRNHVETHNHHFEVISSPPLLCILKEFPASCSTVNFSTPFSSSSSESCLLLYRCLFMSPR